MFFLNPKAMKIPYILFSKTLNTASTFKFLIHKILILFMGMCRNPILLGFLLCSVLFCFSVWIMYCPSTINWKVYLCSINFQRLHHIWNCHKSLGFFWCSSESIHWLHYLSCYSRLIIVNLLSFFLSSRVNAFTILFFFLYKSLGYSWVYDLPLKFKISL